MHKFNEKKETNLCFAYFFPKYKRNTHTNNLLLYVSFTRLPSNSTLVPSQSVRWETENGTCVFTLREWAHHYASTKLKLNAVFGRLLLLRESVPNKLERELRISIEPRTYRISYAWEGEVYSAPMYLLILNCCVYFSSLRWFQYVCIPFSFVIQIERQTSNHFFFSVFTFFKTVTSTWIWSSNKPTTSVIYKILFHLTVSCTPWHCFIALEHYTSFQSIDILLFWFVSPSSFATELKCRCQQWNIS